MTVDPTAPTLVGIESVPLGGGYYVSIGKLPSPLYEQVRDTSWFDAFWNQHPANYHRIMIHGRLVNTPRWQAAFGRDYDYTGAVNHAAPITTEIQPFISWAQANIAPTLNGALVNWYDGALGHYIGAHHDSTKNLDPQAPIVIFSAGESRVLRLRSKQGDGGKWNVPVEAGSVLILPLDTNRAFTHEVPASKRRLGRRISITIRAFR